MQVDIILIKYKRAEEYALKEQSEGAGDNREGFLQADGGTRMGRGPWAACNGRGEE